MTFYKPIQYLINERPYIVYIDEGIEKLLKSKDVKNYVADIISHSLKPADYYVIFLRVDGDDIMTDLWSMSKLGERGSGPLADVEIFRGTSKEEGIGIGSGNALIVLGLEEQHRRMCDTFEKYIRHRPEISEALDLGKDF